MLWTLLFACSLGSAPDPDPSSPAGTLSQEAAALADQAGRVEALATELESQTDEVRRQVAAGTKTQAEAIAELQALADQIVEAQAEVDRSLAALEAHTRESTGMAEPEPPEDKRR